MSLPKATVQLQSPSAPATGNIPPQTYTTVTTDEDEETEEPKIVGILSIVGFIAALVVLFFQISTANSWANAEDNPTPGWGNLF
jgi:hypothetical protein